MTYHLPPITLYTNGESLVSYIELPSHYCIYKWGKSVSYIELASYYFIYKWEKSVSDIPLDLLLLYIQMGKAPSVT